MTNDAASVIKLNRHPIMNGEILKKALNETMVCKTRNGSVSILTKKNCHEWLSTKLVLRYTFFYKKNSHKNFL